MTQENTYQNYTSLKKKNKQKTILLKYAHVHSKNM